MRAYTLFLTLGALTLIGLAATMLVQGGWQAVAAGFATFNGVGFALTFAVIRAMSDRPRRVSVEPAPLTAPAASAPAPAPSRPGYARPAARATSGLRLARGPR
jgi:hypothetical protein